MLVTKLFSRVFLDTTCLLCRRCSLDRKSLSQGSRAGWGYRRRPTGRRVLSSAGTGSEDNSINKSQALLCSICLGRGGPGPVLLQQKTLIMEEP